MGRNGSYGVYGGFGGFGNERNNNCYNGKRLSDCCASVSECEYTGRCFLFSDLDFEGKEMCEMSVPRMNVAACISKDFYTIIAAGGEGREGFLNACEIMGRDHKWKNIAALNKSVSCASVCAFKKSQFYCFGGKNCGYRHIEKYKKCSFHSFLKHNNMGKTAVIEGGKGCDIRKDKRKRKNKYGIWKMVNFEGKFILGVGMGAAEISNKVIIIFGGEIDGQKSRKSYLFSPKCNKNGFGNICEWKLMNEKASFELNQIKVIDEVVYAFSKQDFCLHGYSIQQMYWDVAKNKFF